MLALIDYGMGNLQSVANALESLGHAPVATSTPEDLHQAEGIVLPGVGAFGDGMRNLRASGMVAALNEAVLEQRRPFLGLCLGMQFLADASEENGTHEGLGWISGTVRRICAVDRQHKVPHMGWNAVSVREGGDLFRGLSEPPVFYFVHSYHFDPSPDARKYVTSTCLHGMDLVASVQKDNIYGVQFHPEKSQRDGIGLLENFLRVVYPA